MSSATRRILAVSEVSFIAFAVVPLLALGIYRLVPRLNAWQTTVGFGVPIIFYAVAAAVPVLLALARRKSPAAYGIDFRTPRYHLDIMLTCILPVALVSVLHMRIAADSWAGAPILIAAYLALLFMLAWLLRRKPTAGVGGSLTAGVIGLAGLAPAAGATTGRAAVIFLNYALFVGFGEEMLYRGYIESRLNEVFGRPFRFYGVPFGWGALITSLLFGLMHVGVQRWILGLNHDVTLAWGCWTIFSGLVFSYVREKTGSICAPALLHGLPQAIASVAMLFLK